MCGVGSVWSVSGGGVWQCELGVESVNGECVECECVEWGVCGV